MEGDRSSEAAPAPAPDDELAWANARVGTLISDRYRLHKLLAMGGMGAVYTGEHVHMRKRVAVKLLHPQMQRSAGLLARFEREAIVGAHVEHPNVAAARDFGKLPDGSHYLVLEFVRGVTLRELLRQGSLPLRRSLRIARGIAAGLAAVHAQHIVHRDVAPRNVMVLPGTDDQVKLIDFGFAKVPVERFAALSVPQGTPVLLSELTPADVIFGTIGYLAPEGVLGMRAVRHESDLYALGAMMFEMLAGVPVFEAETQALLFLKHRMERVPRIRERAPQAQVPEEAETIARKLLEKKPSDRYASASDVVAAIDAVLQRLGKEDERRLALEDDASEALQLTVIGAEAPAELPRFEDVAASAGSDEASSTEPLASDREPPSRAPQGEGVPKRTSWLPVALALVVVLAAGAVLAQRYVLRAPAPAEAPTPSSARTNSSAAEPSASLATAGSASLPPSAEPSATTTRPRALDGLDAEGWKRAVKQAPATNNYKRALDGLLALAELDPEALATSELKTVATETAVAFGKHKEAGPKLHAALAERFGSDGVDVLFELITKRGGTDSARLASEQLAKPEVRARGSKALRIALELREAACMDKVKLLDRVNADGDGRALSILVALHVEECDPGVTGCCLQDNALVEAAIRNLAKKSGER